MRLSHEKGVLNWMISRHGDREFSVVKPIVWKNTLVLYAIVVIFFVPTVTVRQFKRVSTLENPYLSPDTNSSPPPSTHGGSNR